MIILCHERPKILGGSGFWEIKAGNSWKFENRRKSTIFGTTQLEIPNSVGGHMMCQNNGREGKEGEGREWPLATLATSVKHLCAARPPSLKHGRSSPSATCVRYVYTYNVQNTERRRTRQV